MAEASLGEHPMPSAPLAQARLARRATSRSTGPASPTESAQAWSMEVSTVMATMSQDEVRPTDDAPSRAAATMAAPPRPWIESMSAPQETALRAAPRT